MLIGKKICNVLKEIRKQIADDNEIEYNPRECNYQGECQGTCPKCESELRYIEQELLKRQNANKKIVLAGIASLTLSSLTSCFGCNQLQGEEVCPPQYRDTTEQNNSSDKDTSQTPFQDEINLIKNDEEDGGRLMGEPVSQ